MPRTSHCRCAGTWREWLQVKFVFLQKHTPAQQAHKGRSPGMRSHASHAKVSAAGCRTLALLVCEGGSKTQSEIVAEGGVELIIAGAKELHLHVYLSGHVHSSDEDGLIQTCHLPGEETGNRERRGVVAVPCSPSNYLERLILFLCVSHGCTFDGQCFANACVRRLVEFGLPSCRYR